MRTKPIILILVITTLLGACVSYQPSIILEEDHFNFGDVINGEIVTYELIVSNQGNSPLEVESVSTSCGCTTATLEPMTIQPGEKGTLHIEFDSGAHGPELTGELVRQIFIVSNDPNMPEAKIEFTANILPKSSP
jgi:hypothetical protein